MKTQYYRARYYDSTIGRFISEDPFGMISGGINLYLYADNGPIDYKDPFGQQKLKDCDQNCAEAAKIKLRVKLMTIVGSPKWSELYYDLAQADGQSYVIFQLESNPGRAGSTTHGPGSYGDSKNHFLDNIRIGPGESPSDSVQTFFAIPATWSKDKYGNETFKETGAPIPVLVQDLDGHDFCRLAVHFDPSSGATVNGNPVQENLRSFDPPKVK